MQASIVLEKCLRILHLILKFRDNYSRQKMIVKIKIAEQCFSWNMRTSKPELQVQ